MYLNAQEEIDLMDKLYFDKIRLGDIKENIKIIEQNIIFFHLWQRKFHAAK